MLLDFFQITLFNILASKSILQLNTIILNVIKYNDSKF